jgi:hypothetical protein
MLCLEHVKNRGQKYHPESAFYSFGRRIFDIALVLKAQSLSLPRCAPDIQRAARSRDERKSSGVKLLLPKPRGLLQALRLSLNLLGVALYLGSSKKFAPHIIR